MIHSFLFPLSGDYFSERSEVLQCWSKHVLKHSICEPCYLVTCAPAVQYLQYGVDPTANKREGNAYVTYSLPKTRSPLKDILIKTIEIILQCVEWNFEGKNIFFPLLCDVYNVYLQAKCDLSLILILPFISILFVLWIHIPREWIHITSNTDNNSI